MQTIQSLVGMCPIFSFSLFYRLEVTLFNAAITIYVSIFLLCVFACDNIEDIFRGQFPQAINTIWNRADGRRYVLQRRTQSTETAHTFVNHWPLAATGHWPARVLFDIFYNVRTHATTVIVPHRIAFRGRPPVGVHNARMRDDVCYICRPLWKCVDKGGGVSLKREHKSTILIDAMTEIITAI